MDCVSLPLTDATFKVELATQLIELKTSGHLPNGAKTKPRVWHNDPFEIEVLKCAQSQDLRSFGSYLWSVLGSALKCRMSTYTIDTSLTGLANVAQDCRNRLKVQGRKKSERKEAGDKQVEGGSADEVDRASMVDKDAEEGRSDLEGEEETKDDESDGGEHELGDNEEETAVMEQERVLDASNKDDFSK
ncbi:hypothetical protein P7C70_g8510, partial [Phenoliferia sp. Uapishka_3]